MTAPRFRIRKTDDEGEVLHESCTHWVVYDEDKDPVAYLSARLEGTRMYIASVGVLPHARGNRLQVRLMRAAMAWARGEGAELAWSYTSPLNVASANSFIAAGFTLYLPETAESGVWLYWKKNLVTLPPTSPQVH
jgi:GNAT superfamily N-acetyltransferase